MLGNGYHAAAAFLAATIATSVAADAWAQTTDSLPTESQVAVAQQPWDESAGQNEPGRPPLTFSTTPPTADTGTDDVFGQERLLAKKRPYMLQLQSQFRGLVVADEDPRNDRSMIHQFRADYRAYEGLQAFGVVGLNQRFTAEEDDAHVRSRDSIVGAQYVYRLPLGFADKELSLFHRMMVYFPTSRESQNQDLIFAPDLENRVRYPITKRFEAGINVGAQYRYHEYAERAGPEAGQNVMFVLPMAAVAEYTIFDLPKYGSLLVGADGKLSHAWQYASREDFQSDASDQRFDAWSYGWSTYLEYYPNDYLIAAIGIEHGGQVLRDGVVNTFFSHRDETEFVATLVGRY